MIFILLLVLITFSIAGCAAWFSIIGLAQIFTGSFWPVVFMGVSLEAGKLITASYLYRFWQHTSFLMKTYMFLAVFVLMIITSTGIFGFLSSAYQTDILPLKEMEQSLLILKEEKAELANTKSKIEDIIAKMPANHSTLRIKTIASYKPEMNQIIERTRQINKSIAEISSKKINQEVHTGPIVFVAKAFGGQVDDATKYMILMIIFVFDPLAIMLTIAANIAIRQRESKVVKIQQTETVLPTREEGVEIEESVEIEEAGEVQQPTMSNSSTVTFEPTDDIAEFVNTYDRSGAQAFTLSKTEPAESVVNSSIEVDNNVNDEKIDSLERSINDKLDKITDTFASLVPEHDYAKEHAIEDEIMRIAKRKQISNSVRTERTQD